MTTTAVDDLFAPSHYAAVRRPLLEAETLPPWCYTSPEFYRREVERIFMRCWNFLGRADRIPAPGDYFTVDLVGQPLVIVRGQDGEIRAFANICRHRGSIIMEGEGNCRVFVCPYHSWSYELDGRLRRAPEMDRTCGFDPQDWSLLPVRLETWGGFIFVNFDATAEPLAEYLGDLPGRLASHRLDDMVCTRVSAYDIACNWKLWVENAKESYHIGTVHAKTINKYASAKAAGYQVEETTGQYITTAAQHEGSMALLKGARGFPRIPTLEGKAALGTLAPMIYPSTYLGCTIDTVWYLQLLPMGPEKTRLVHGACFPRAVTERDDFEEIAANYYERWDITTEEDIAACERQQRGLAAPMAAAGRFCHREPLVHRIDNWVLDRVLDGEPAPA